MMRKKSRDFRRLESVAVLLDAMVSLCSLTEQSVGTRADVQGRLSTTTSTFLSPLRRRGLCAREEREQGKGEDKVLAPSARREARLDG